VLLWICGNGSSTSCWQECKLASLLGTAVWHYLIIAGYGHTDSQDLLGTYQVPGATRSFCPHKPAQVEDPSLWAGSSTYSGHLEHLSRWQERMHLRSLAAPCLLGGRSNVRVLWSWGSINHPSWCNGRFYCSQVEHKDDHQLTLIQCQKLMSRKESKLQEFWHLSATFANFKAHKLLWMDECTWNKSTTCTWERHTSAVFLYNMASASGEAGPTPHTLISRKGTWVWGSRIWRKEDYSRNSRTFNIWNLLIQLLQFTQVPKTEIKLIHAKVALVKILPPLRMRIAHEGEQREPHAQYSSRVSSYNPGTMWGHPHSYFYSLWKPKSTQDDF
jgi:hypothetical protein